MEPVTFIARISFYDWRSVRRLLKADADATPAASYDED
jgi:hypothetical protein